MKIVRIRKITLAAAIALVLLLPAACRSEAAEPPPTRAPAPTFTPTTEIQPTPVDPSALATAQASILQPAEPAEPAPAPQGDQQPAADSQPTPQPADTPTPEPTPTPEAKAAEVLVNQQVNVRSGPGTTYAIVGAANQGQRFPITGKSPAGDWWQVNFNGQNGWVFGQLVTAQNTEAVQVAQNIPAAPTLPPAPPPTNTPVPQPTQPPAPTAPPKSSYEFNVAVLQRCDPNAGVTYVNGTVYKNGQPVNGNMVAFSYAPDGPPVATIQAGPHQGYEGWRTGFYSHILETNGAREGTWYFWIVDGTGKRISDISPPVHTDGTAGDGKCQQAIVDFDSR